MIKLRARSMQQGFIDAEENLFNHNYSVPRYCDRVQ